MAHRKPFRDNPVGNARQELLAAQRAADRKPTKSNTRHLASAEKALLIAVDVAKGRKSGKK